MVFLSIDTLELEEQVEHLATDWEISDTENFERIVVSSIQDEINKNSIIFSDSLDPNQKWYARARALLTTGYTELSNIHIFLPSSENGVATGDDLPSRISIPIIKTDSDQNYHDTTLFSITAEGFSVIGNTSHYSTSWWIEDIYNNVIWYSLHNTIYKNKILISDLVLRTNHIYRIKVVFHSTSNDSSPIATYTICTNKGTDIELLTYLDYIDPTENIELNISTLEGMDTVTWEIYEYVKDGVFEFIEDPNRDEIVVNDFESQGKYGMLPDNKTPSEGRKCQNNFAENDKLCEGIIVKWARVLDTDIYSNTLKKYKKYKLFIDMYLNTLYIANNMVNKLISPPEPDFCCEKCGTLYFNNEDGTTMAIPMAPRNEGITNFRAIPNSKYQIIDYEPDTYITGFGPISVFTHQNELYNNPDYEPPYSIELEPLKGVTYKNLIWESNYPNKPEIQITGYAISKGATDDDNRLLVNFGTLNLHKGTFEIPTNDSVDRLLLYFHNPKESLDTYAGINYLNFNMIDVIDMKLPHTGRDVMATGPFKYFLRYPMGEIVENQATTSDENKYIQYTYDRGDNLKIVGYIEYNNFMYPTKWVNVTEDVTSYIELNENYTDEYYQGLSKELYGQTIWY